MKISVNRLRKINQLYGTADDIAPHGAQALAEKIGAQLGAIEETIDVGSKYQGVIIAKVMSCEDHPDADRLHVCKLDDGGKAQNVERDENSYVQVVCGAPNVREGILVAWLSPGTTVPESVGKDPFVLDARPLRGVVSNGMLASPRELSIGDSHEGILEIDEDVAPGTDFADHFGLASDVVFDIENKMFTHRPDCFGWLGISRELAGIQNMPFKSPDWYRTDAEVPAVETDVLPLEVSNEIPELVPRFMAITMSDIEIKPSPLWLQIALSNVGLRPINNIVDFTNYFMLETGQPIHAYDYDKVKSFSADGVARMSVRFPKPGEKITLLNGKTIEPRAEAMMVVVGDDHLACVGGAMGGADTEVDENTKNIIIEAANWDMYSMRRTSMAHGIFTDAVTRFTKGQSPLQNRAVIAKLVDDIRKNAGGKVAGELIDINSISEEVMERQSLHAPVQVTTEFINTRLGLHFNVEAIAQLLTNVEFDVIIEGDSLTAKAPFWRTDIEIAEDVVEEVGRLYGFDRLPMELPARPIVPAANNANIALKQAIREALSGAGANEILSYSFVHSNLLEKTGQNPAQAYKLDNALSPDLQYFRLSLTPSLLDRVHPNIKSGFDKFGLFEIGKAHIKGMVDEHQDGLPAEFERVAFVFAADAKSAKNYDGAAYYQAQKYLRTLLDGLHMAGDTGFEPQATDDADVAAGYFAPGRVAVVKIDGQIVGRIGEYKASVRKALKLPDYCAGFELSITALAKLQSQESSYVSLSRYPAVEQDICLRVAATTTYAQVYDLATGVLAEQQSETMRVVVTPVDMYQRAQETDHKQITLRVQIADYAKTMRDSEVTEMLNAVTLAAGEQLQAERI
jgi:phenylalanyl-tRNA synthetase beta chain